MQPVGEQVGAWGLLQAQADTAKDKIWSWEEALHIEPDECGPLEAPPVRRCVLDLEANDAEIDLGGSAEVCFPSCGKNWRTFGFPIPHCHLNYVSSCFLIKRVIFLWVYYFHLLIVCFLSGLSVLHVLNWTCFILLILKQPKSPMTLGLSIKF